MIVDDIAILQASEKFRKWEAFPQPKDGFCSAVQHG